MHETMSHVPNLHEIISNMHKRGACSHRTCMYRNMPVRTMNALKLHKSNHVCTGHKRTEHACVEQACKTSMHKRGTCDHRVYMYRIMHVMTKKRMLFGTYNRTLEAK